MLLKLQRNQPQGESLTGTLYLNGEAYCRTLERTSKAIPALWYHVAVTMSPHFKRLLPLVEAVPGRSGIRFHRGTKPEHSRGCILVGKRAAEGAWTMQESAQTEKELTNIILNANKKREEVFIAIQEPDPAPYYDVPCPADECAPRNRELD